MNIEDQFWWESPAEDSPAHIFKLVNTLEEEQRDTLERFQRFAWLYDQSQLLGAEQSYQTGPYGTEQFTVTENIIKSVIDTVKSLIAKNRPKATFLTDGAEWHLQRTAKHLERFVEAEFHRTHVYERGVEVFGDACVFGIGALKIFEKDGRVSCERTLVDEFRVDESECRGAAPRSLHQVKPIDKHVLKHLFPEYEQEIDDCVDESNKSPYWSSSRKLKPNQALVIESWHLPSGSKATDGRHTIAISNCLLVDEPWKKDCFPFVFLRWSKKLTGFFGRGLAEDLSGIQSRINKHNRMISKAQDLIAVPRVLTHVSDGSLNVKITNQVGEIIPWRHQKPEFVTPPAVSPEIYADKDRLKSTAYQISGVSELSATSRKPGGLDSAVALREYNDIETQRFAIQAQDYETFFLQVAEQYVGLAKEIYSGKNFTAVWRTRSLIKRIKWDEVNLEEEMYQMSIEASSILNRSPSGRLSAIIELAQSQLIDDKDKLLRLLGHPDLERETDLETAAIEDIEAVIENLLDDKFETPEPFQNLALGINRIQQAYLKARREGAPENIKENMRQWIEQAQMMLAPARQSAGMPPGPPGQQMPPDLGGAPPGPMPPPGPSPLPSGGGLPQATPGAPMLPY